MDMESSEPRPILPNAKSIEVFQEIIRMIPYAIELLKPLRRARRIVDFKYISLNEAAQSTADSLIKTGKKFLTIRGNDRELFEKLKRVSETGIPDQSIVMRHRNGTDTWYVLRISKYYDAVICAWEDITERKNAEIFVQNSSVIADSVHDAICSVDHQGYVRYWNPAAVSLFGYLPTESIGQKLESLIGFEKYSVLAKALDQVFNDNLRITDLSTVVRRKDGKLLDMLLNVLPLTDANQKITGACLVCKDITEVGNIRNKIREDQHFIGQIIETTPDIIYIMDLNTYQVIYTNRQLAADLDYTKSDIAAMKNPILDIMHPDDVGMMKNHLKQIQTINTDDEVLEIQFRLKKPGGGYNWYCDRNSVFKRDSRGKPVEKIGICQNITVRKRDEERWKTSADIIKQSEQLVGIGSWEYEVSTGDFKWSDGMYSLFKIDRDTSVRPEIYFEYTPDDERPVVEKIVRGITEDFKPFEETITLLPNGDERKILKIKAIVTKDKTNMPLKVIGVDVDITNQVEANFEIDRLYNTVLRNNQELRVLGDEIKLLNKICTQYYKDTLHQLYTNLEYVSSHDARYISDVGKGNIRKAQAAIQKMNLLTSDVSSYFALYDMHAPVSEVDPAEIISLVVANIQPKLVQYNATVEFTELPLIPSHPSLFSQLVTALFDQAFKSRNLLSPLTIKIKYSYADELNSIPGSLKDTPYVIISFSDNGVGFAEEELPRLFDLEHQLSTASKKKTTGMGPVMCKRIMAMHSGFITGEVYPARGSTYNCYFPVRNEKNFF